MLAELDPEEYFDFQANRPTIAFSDGAHRRIEWPRNTFIAARAQGADRDLVLLDGTEPNLKWRTYSETIVKVAEFLKVETVVALGSLIAEVAHTMPVPITGLASDDVSGRRSSTSTSSDYEGPTGIVGVVHDRCRAAGIASVSLWAAVPHYVAAVPNPKAALALSERLEKITGVAADLSGLDEETAAYEEQIGRAVVGRPGGRRTGRPDRDPSSGSAARANVKSRAATRSRWSSSASSSSETASSPERPAGATRQASDGRADQPEVAPAADPG